MKLTDIVVHLAAQLPHHTTKFHDILQYTSIAISSNGLVTVVTTLPHGLNTGSYITISNIKVKRKIIELTVDEVGVATVEVDTPHDLTRGWQSTVEISGCTELVFNGNFPLIDVPNRRFFTFRLPEGETPNEATGENMVFHETLELGLEGAYTITVINETTFTFYMETDVDLGNFDGVIARKQRVMGCATIDRFIQLYEKHFNNQYFAVVVMDDGSISKDRRSLSDAIANTSIQSDFRSILLEPFRVYVFIPTEESLSGLEAIDECYEEIKLALYKTLNGYKFPSGLSERSDIGVQPVGHGMFDYNNAYYVHQYLFETNKEVTIEDSAYYTGNLIQPTRAFRDLVFRQHNEYRNELIGKNINLDDIPLPGDSLLENG